jgi:flagellar biosynthesis protein FlhG
MTEGRILGVASGKGGVGKTWFAITLAHALARRDRRILLFDADLGLANVDIQLGLLPDRDISSVLMGRATLTESVIQHPEGKFDIVAGRSGSGALSLVDPTALDRILLALRQLAQNYDALLLDLGAGLERTVRHLAAWTDTLLVLATDEPTSLTDAYAVLKLHHTDKPLGEARIVVNQAANRQAGERTFATLRRACQTFLGSAPPLAGVIRRDEHVRDTIRHQTLLLARFPAAPAAADVDAIAATLLTT